MDTLLAIDAGTTSVKAGLFSPDRRLLVAAREEYLLDTPSAERAQLDPRVYWQACINTVRQVVAQSEVNPGEIRVLCVSSQGETTISIGPQGQPLYPAMVWLDNRAGEQAAWLAKQFSGSLYTVTGIPEMLPTWTACKILWLKENEPQAFAQAWKFMLVQDYLIYQMTGRAVTDGSVACTTALFDIRRAAWWLEMLAAIGIDAESLPEIVQPGTTVGTLSSLAAQALGLSQQTLVVTGGMDQATGAIGAGNIAPGTISESTGAALAIQATITDPALDPNQIVPVYCHSVPGLYLSVPVCPTAGMALKWVRDTFFQAEIAQAAEQGLDTYDLMTALATNIAPGADGLVLLPHLMGAFSPRPNQAARGSFTGFTLSHQRGHFVRAVLEGVTFMLRQNLDSIQQAGIPVRELRSTGGGARSPLWNQIKADVCKIPVITLQNEDTALLGDAILAGVACGAFSSIEEGCARMVTAKDEILPGPNSDPYQQAYQRYCDLDSSLAGFFKRSYGANETIKIPM
jgi:sugar (pentulose or hexulose) kinase